MINGQGAAAAFSECVVQTCIVHLLCNSLQFALWKERGATVRFLKAASPRAKQSADQTFALTLAHIDARISEILALRGQDDDLDAGTVRVQTLKRRVEYWREVPVPPDLLRPLELVHALRSLAPAPRCIVAVVASAGIGGP